MKKHKLSPELTWEAMNGAVQAMLANPATTRDEPEHIVGRAMAISVLLHKAMDTMFGDQDKPEEGSNDHPVAH